MNNNKPCRRVLFEAASDCGAMIDYLSQQPDDGDHDTYYHTIPDDQKHISEMEIFQWIILQFLHYVEDIHKFSYFKWYLSIADTL